jgi:hypothetical protein
METTDIEIIINDEEDDYSPRRRKRSMRTVQGGKSVGNRYLFTEEGVLESCAYEPSNICLEPVTFHDNGIMKTYMYIFDISNGHKSYYFQSWRSTGLTAETHWWINRKDRYTSNEYDKQGRLRIKKVYKDNGEKDYAVVYWYGPALPVTEDGFLKKGCI